MDPSTEDPSTEADCRQALSRFGLSEFRPGQDDVISSIIAGKNCLCIMPTGGGKSLCYQLPSVVRDGVTVVISPLIALMKDQVDSLTAINVSATCINSAIDSSEQRRRMDGMVAGEYDLVYIAPERLRSSAFINAIKASKLQLLAIDEAHCISEWGHDFRPDYARIGRFRQELGNPQTIALTATATETVREDIRAQLELEKPATFITGFARSNLSFEVLHTKTMREKQETLLAFINANNGAGIVYAATRKRCEELVDLLRKNLKRRVGFYHAGLMPDDRRAIQEEFMSGEVPIIVATNAFGMGIDKSDLRFVVHYNLPGTIEAYYQEAGRAGRDGQPSRCLLLFSYPDKGIQEFFIENAYPPAEIVEQVYDFLRGRTEDPIELTLQETKEEMGVSISSEGIGVCEQLLHKCKGIERLDSQQNMGSVRIATNLPTLVDLLPREAKLKRRVLREVEREVGKVTDSSPPTAQDKVLSNAKGKLRGERVYFHPRHMAERLKIKVDSLSRTLRELNRLDAFDYVSPFRGKAVHVVDRTKPFKALKVDFAELDRRRRAEYDKLDAVVQYAYTNRCRQLTILEYFGDSNRVLCGNCDCCGVRGQLKPLLIGTAEGQQAADGKAPDAAMVHVVRICLSGVARTHGRFGKTLIGQMLWGSSDKKVKKLGLSRLSTFGMLKRLTQKEVHTLLDAISNARLVQQVETQRYRPLTSITDKGLSVMKGSQSLDASFSLPLALTTRISQLFAADAEETTPKSQSDASEVRESIAQSDDSLSEPIVEERPIVSVDRSGNQWVDAASFLTDETAAEEDVSGGNTDEETVANEERPRSTETESLRDEQTYRVDEPQRQQPQTHSATGSRVSSDFDEQHASYWTWRLFADGYQLAEVIAVRRMDSDEVFQQLVVAASEGQTVDPAWAIPKAHLKLLDDYRAAISFDELNLSSDIQAWEKLQEPPAESTAEVPTSVPPAEFALYFAIHSQRKRQALQRER